MKITRIVDLHADAGWRVLSFLKIETDSGVVGWSEYNESYGSKGLTAVVMKLAETLIGQDPSSGSSRASMPRPGRHPAVSCSRPSPRSRTHWST
jgi:L-alanine-DL-glutamate epimerase-like enolase superfamily enzyme